MSHYLYLCINYSVMDATANSGPKWQCFKVVWLEIPGSFRCSQLQKVILYQGPDCEYSF